jgi:hypothetical protein
MDSPKIQSYKSKMEEVLQEQEKKAIILSYVDINMDQQPDEQTRRALRYRDAMTTRPSYVDAVQTVTPVATAKK